MFEIMSLAKNIKRYRKKKGLKQHEFAELLGISPQSVSKWECGLTSPSIENLCEIASILDVSLDMLVNQQENTERKMIGIDGGGSKTEFVLFSETGKIFNRLVLSGSNPNTVGFQNAVHTLIMGIDTLLGIEEDVCGIFSGISGLDSGSSKNLERLLTEKYPTIKIQCENDVFNVIANGSNPDQCIAAICGTGVAVYANNHGALKRFGGRGYLLDEGGSGYHIGKDALCAALDAEDGITEHSILVDFVQEKIGGNVWVQLQNLYKNDQSYISAFAPCVFKAYENGDDTAAHILEKNAEHLARLLHLAAKNCTMQKHIVASGSIFTKNTIFSEILKTKLMSGLILEVSHQPPVYGACVMCCKLCGINPSNLKETFMTYYNSYI